MNRSRKNCLAAGLLLAFGLNGSCFAERESAAFALVNGEAIEWQTYQTALRAAGRQKFYHGKAPEAELTAFRRQVGERLVDERLMLQEAAKRGIAADPAWVEAEFQKFARRYAASPEWGAPDGEVQTRIREGLQARSRIARLEERMREVAEPSERELRQYYERNADKFTSPEQVKVSSILLKVDPWEPSSVWDVRQSEAQTLHLAVTRRGASFDELAARYDRLEKGDLGYLHRGMLGQTAQDAIDKLQEGEISAVVTLLEGVAIFRLDERKPATLNPLSEVRERALGLLQRERGEQARLRAMDELRKGSRIEFSDPDYFRPQSQANATASLAPSKP